MSAFAAKTTERETSIDLVAFRIQPLLGVIISIGGLVDYVALGFKYPPMTHIPRQVGKDGI